MSGPSIAFLRSGLPPAWLIAVGIGFMLALTATPPSRAGEVLPDGSVRMMPDPDQFVVRPVFDIADEIATLEAVHFALSQIGDGSSYVWHRRNRRLSGIVHPTASFKDTTGKVCRHIVLELSSGDFARRTEGIACRLHTGVWQLEG
jgi:hypothetical protein